jgi:hypothetical protein
MPVRLPSNFSDRVAPFPSTFVLQTEVSLPEGYRKPPVTLVLPQFEPVATLRINGETLVPLEDEPDHPFRRVYPQRFPVPPEALARGKLQIAIDAPNLYASASWVQGTPHLSPTMQGGPTVMALRKWNGALALSSYWILVGIALYFAVLFVAEREKIYIFFALNAVLAAQYPGYVAGLTQTYWGAREAPMMGVCFALAAWPGAWLPREHLGLAPPSYRWGIVVLLVATLDLWTVDPSVNYRWGAWSTIVLLALKCALDIKTYRQARAAGPLPWDGVMALLAWPLVGLASVPDALAIAGVSQTMPLLRTGPTGMTFVFLIDSIAVGMRQKRIMRGLHEELEKRYDALTAQTESVRQLNEELRRQINTRAEELALALARLARSKPRSNLNPGDEVHGRYLIQKLIGRGAMGAVYEARRLMDQKAVALKVLTCPGDTESLARFAREAQIASQIAHPNLVSVFDLDVNETGDFYLVMELIDGPTLRDCTHLFGPTPWSMRVLLQIASGLAALHEVGTLHRDLKPSNVLLAPTGKGDEVVAKIADFGVSIASESSGSSGDENVTLTRTGHVLGTPVYMPPEALLDSRGATILSDIFTFGVMAREVLSGSPPRSDPPLGYVLHAVPDTEIPSVAALSPTLPPKIVAMVDACLRSDPSKRPTAQELATAFAEALHILESAA